jgi:ribosome biogenesis GTPase
VIVLNKADACDDPRIKAGDMEHVAVGTTVCVVSARTGEGFGELEEFLRPGETLVLLGSSGVGKSTIANRLLGHAVQEVQPVRESDSRGRHATTSRQLFILPGGALLMDTPGLREMQLWEAEEGVVQVFADIDALAGQCRFGDCRHEGEPGCAVQAALEKGTLDPARLENRRKLMREQEFLRRKIDPEARQQQKEHWKQIHRAARQKYQQRGRDGGKR